MSRLPRALFVCVHNAGRSQMAEALYRRAGGEARSAGSDPGTAVHPEVVTAMAELGIDVSGCIPHRLSPDDAAWAEVVVTMGCGDACPYIPGRRYVDWDLEDPKGKDIDTVRRIRDEIVARIEALAAESA